MAEDVPAWMGARFLLFLGQMHLGLVSLSGSFTVNYHLIEGLTGKSGFICRRGVYTGLSHRDNFY